MKFLVRAACNRTGLGKRYYFSSLEDARRVVNEYFRQTKIVLSIVECKKTKRNARANAK